MPTVEVEIRDDRGRALPSGDEGEVYVRSPMVMLEYWRNPQATAEAIHPGRWLRTGDFGRISDGRLYLSSRKRDLILRGGENVYPAEIELRLEAHPDVAEAAVVGAPHAELGEEVKAIVVPACGARLDPAALARWVAEALADFKVPARWEVRAEPLPRNATGKVMKHVLRDGGESAFVQE
jgi:acyl-CoA synthetase (AMP-forming)/AMP-acid ligase II